MVAYTRLTMPLTVHIVIFDGKVLSARVSILIDGLKTEQNESGALCDFPDVIWSLNLVNLVFDADDLDQLVFSA